MTPKQKHSITALLIGTLLTVTTTSCSLGNKQEETEVPTITKEYKIVDMLEVIKGTGYDSESMYYILLENGNVEILGASRGRLTKEEAKKIMAFRRGEEVTYTVKEPAPAK